MDDINRTLSEQQIELDPVLTERLRVLNLQINEVKRETIRILVRTMLIERTIIHSEED